MATTDPIAEHVLDRTADAQANDLDETRRLLYAALAAPYTDKYTLVGTLTNALAHHGLGLEAASVMGYLLRLVDPDVTNGVDADAAAWVKTVIDDISDKRQDGAWTHLAGS